MVIAADVIIESAPRTDLAAPSREWTREQSATMTTLDGRRISGGSVEFIGTAVDWRATVRHLDRPGCMAALYFGEGVRDVVLNLQDGRRVRARISRTTFVAGAERVCEVVGLERLS